VLKRTCQVFLTGLLRWHEILSDTGMQTNILWTGKAYYSLENCLVSTGATASIITSTIIGLYDGAIYKVDYRIKTNANWETIFLEINSRHNNRLQTIRFEGDGKGNWTNNGQKDEQFNGCVDVDIAVTPFTNTLPIRRLNLVPNQSQEIKVVYCDLLAQEVKPVRQQYTCLSPTQYHYQNIPNDFEAVIEVDKAGLVVDYPTLFVRTVSMESE
jgi:uncharacterized protein